MNGLVRVFEELNKEKCCCFGECLGYIQRPPEITFTLLLLKQ